MPDIYSKEKRSAIMSKNGSHRGCEELPYWLKYQGLQRKPRGIFGNPDFANKSRKIAVFIDGCFWHGCPWHYQYPQNNSDYWIPKIQRTMERDREVTEQLKSEGWTVIRLWGDT